jgi:hypothetical protein
VTVTVPRALLYVLGAVAALMAAACAFLVFLPRRRPAAVPPSPAAEAERRRVEDAGRALVHQHVELRGAGNVDDLARLGKSREYP